MLLHEPGQALEDLGQRGAAGDELEQLRLAGGERLRALAIADVARGRGRADDRAGGARRSARSPTRRRSRLPSLRMQTVSSGSTRSPRLRRSSMYRRRSPLPGSSSSTALADHLLGAVAEDALGRRVPARDLAVGRARDDRVEGRADDCLALEQRRLALLLLGDVEDVALDAERRAGLVVHEHALVAHPGEAAVAPHASGTRTRGARPSRSGRAVCAITRSRSSGCRTFTKKSGSDAHSSGV